MVPLGRLYILYLLVFHSNKVLPCIISDILVTLTTPIWGGLPPIGFGLPKSVYITDFKCAASLISVIAKPSKLKKIT